MKLYFHPLSGNSRRALLAATHLGVPLEPIVIDLTKGEQRDAPHLARNPNGRLPVLDDNGFLLWESRAIMQYLCDKTPGQTLMPTDAQGRAEVNRWLFWCAMHMAPPEVTMVQENFVKPLMGRPTDPAELAKAETTFKENAAILDKHLAGRTWVAQDHVTIADYSLAAGLALATPAKFPIGDFSNLRAWLARVQELDAWTKTMPQMPPRPA